MSPIKGLIFVFPFFALVGENLAENHLGRWRIFAWELGVNPLGRLA